jgi:hypothetical protein
MGVGRTARSITDNDCTIEGVKRSSFVAPGLDICEDRLHAGRDVESALIVT